MAGEVDGERSCGGAGGGIFGDPFAGREHPTLPGGTFSSKDAEGGAAEGGEA